MDKLFILKITARRDDGKRRTSQQLFVGKPEEATAEAIRIHNTLRQKVATGVSVGIWQVIATEYKWKIRG